MKLTKEIRIALVAIVGILVMYFGINFLKGINLFSTNNTYYMTFDDIQGMGAYSLSMPMATRWVPWISWISTIPERVPSRSRWISTRILRIPAGSTAEISKDIMGNLQVESPACQ